MDLDKKMTYCSRCKQATYCSTTCQRRHWKEHGITSMSEAQSLSTPTRLVVYAAFEAYISYIMVPIKYPLHSSMRLGHDSLHLTDIAVFKWDYVKGKGYGSSKDFRLLAIDIETYDEFKAEMRSGERDVGDPTRVMVESLCSQEGLAKVSSLDPNAKPSHAPSSQPHRRSPIVASFHRVDVVGIPNAPPFPIDENWLANFRLDLQVPSKTETVMKEFVIFRTGKADEWLDVNEAWYNNLNAKESAEINQKWDGDQQWHAERNTHKASKNARKKARKARSKANAKAGIVEPDESEGSS